MQAALGTHLPCHLAGFGISYTHFAYGSLKATLDAGGIEIRFTLKNTGHRAGSEIAEGYATLPDAAGERPRRLIGWQRVDFAAGEAREVRMTVPMPRLQIFGDAGASAPGSGDAWRTVPGVYRIEVGSSSRDLPLHAEFAIGTVH
ncbi:MAG TPA: fibronectin type III-like domain-contianing protein [Terriglobales bacterium]|nr:fibronectin type III-like domain-contianing protein [Terriglobales bacterium]